MKLLLSDTKFMKTCLFTILGPTLKIEVATMRIILDGAKISSTHSFVVKWYGSIANSMVSTLWASKSIDLMVTLAS